MAIGAQLDLVRNPHNASDFWMTDWLHRRRVYTDEYAFWTSYVGMVPTNISAQWFDSIPVA